MQTNKVLVCLSATNKTRPQGRVFSCGGFTTVELIVTIVILGIIAAVAGPKFFSTNKFTEMGFADVAASATRYAHKLALASGCATRVQLTTTQISLFQRATDCTTGNFTSAVTRIGGTSWVEDVPAGVVVSPMDIYFDNTGRPFDHASAVALTLPLTVTIGSRSFDVEAETGYVHQ